MIPFALLNGKNITLKNFSVDFAVPALRQLQVLDVNRARNETKAAIYPSGYYRIEDGAHVVSVMKEARAGKCHNHAIGVARAYDVVVADRTAGFGYDGSSAFMRALDVVAERKKRIASDGNAAVFRNPRALFFFQIGRAHV